MFRNLFRQSADFRNYNHWEFPETFEPISEAYLREQVRRRFDFAEPLDPTCKETFSHSLKRGSCELFRREHSRWPIIDRDYYLSKTFQFVFITLVEAFNLDEGDAYEVEQRVAHVVNGIPDNWLSNLDELFDIEHLIYLTGNFRNSSNLRGMLKALDLSWFLQGDAPARNLEAAPPGRTRKLRFTEFRRTAPCSVKEFCARAQVDKADLYKWTRDELPDTSERSRRIEEVLRSEW